MLIPVCNEQKVPISEHLIQSMYESAMISEHDMKPICMFDDLICSSLKGQIDSRLWELLQFLQ